MRQGASAGGTHGRHQSQQFRVNRLRLSLIHRSANRVAEQDDARPDIEPADLTTGSRPCRPIEPRFAVPAHLVALRRQAQAAVRDQEQMTLDRPACLCGWGG